MTRELYGLGQINPENEKAYHALALSELEEVCHTHEEPFEGKSKLEIETQETTVSYQTEIDKAGVICAFYICLLPFIKC